ncbi:MAG: Holliday junction branch migration protein RuvA [Eubacteriales bacterium]|jgi:Holliday junction DNA helicase RuvA|nr:Holliday junction branch migration protein RuvA [Eubacteriales bacterium]
MIRFLKGTYHIGLKRSVIIETNSGVGFEVFVPDNSPIYKNLEGQQVKIFTHMMVREDDVSLYGFHNIESLELFELLITVNGVGAKAGMAIMSVLSPMELKRAIGTGDIKAISTANGVGKKMSERIILELKDKVGTFEQSDSIDTISEASFNDERSEAVAALVSLGYSKSEATDAIGKVKSDSLTCEEYIKKALRDLF